MILNDDQLTDTSILRWTGMPITDQSMYIYLGSTVRVDCDAEKYIKQRKSKARYAWL